MSLVPFGFGEYGGLAPFGLGEGEEEVAPVLQFSLGGGGARASAQPKLDLMALADEYQRRISVVYISPKDDRLADPVAERARIKGILADLGAVYLEPGQHDNTRNTEYRYAARKPTRPRPGQRRVEAPRLRRELSTACPPPGALSDLPPGALPTFEGAKAEKGSMGTLAWIGILAAVALGTGLLAGAVWLGGVLYQRSKPDVEPSE